MVKATKKTATPATKKPRTLNERLDFIEGMIAGIAYVIMSAEIKVKDKPTKKIAKKAKK